MSCGTSNAASVDGRLLNCINNPAAMCHARWQWNAHTPACGLIRYQKILTKCGERWRLTIIRDEAQDEPVVCGYEDGVAAEGRCRVELLSGIAPCARAHSARTNQLEKMKFGGLATYIQGR